MSKLFSINNNLIVAILIATIVICSCKESISLTSQQNRNELPIQVVSNMSIISSKNGKVERRLVAPLMEKYKNDTLYYELFPKGIEVYSYDEEGNLESTIRADLARHQKNTRYYLAEEWTAFGNVIIENIKKKEKMSTDTIYWDKHKGRIFTNSYVKLSSPSSMMQGYGMESDDKFRNAIINKPFESYTTINKQGNRKN